MRKRIFLITFLIIALFFSVGSIYYIFTREDKESTLNILEKQWIENNKNEIKDFGVVNNIAILNFSTDSLIFDFINKLEQTTGLEFNKVSYEYGDDVKEEYAFKVTKELKDNDILVYSDNYVLVSSDKVKYNSLDDIKNGVVAVINSDIESISKYLNNDSISYKSIDNTYSELISMMNDGSLGANYIAVPKLIYLSNYSNIENLYINYNINEYKDNYVISLGSIDKLNDILTKYFNKWHSEHYENMYNKEFANIYYKYSDIDEQSKVKFKSKRYIYGFVENSPFDLELNGKLYGINASILKHFSKTTGAELTFRSYSSSKKLLQALDTNEIDFLFDRYSSKEFNIDTYNTNSMYDENVVIISPDYYDISINSLNSLENNIVAAISNTMVYDSIKDKCSEVKKYNKLKDLFNYRGLIAIDLSTYNFYKNTSFKNYKIDYMYSLESNYTYLIRDIKNNKVFEDFLDFYVTFINEDSYINDGYLEALNSVSKNDQVRYFIYSSIGLLLLVISFFLGSKLMPNKKEKRKKISMKKEDKLKYIDMLTSLKNRNYLNDNIELWDDSEIYPQSIIIIDLNNIAYINDNYGHQEGDNVIKEAANILINNQISNTDIIRTNGNEFLIYMVGYDEKQVVSYTKKISKELKDLSHGFGAAFGYSMITDGIKTIDDAVNEATLDMRNNKEEMNN